MEVEEKRHADHEPQYAKHSWRGAWRQGRGWSPEGASQNGRQGSRRLTTRERVLQRMRPSTRRGSRSTTRSLEKSRLGVSQTELGHSSGSRPCPASDQHVEDFDDYEDEEATTQTGSNRLRNIRFSERENMVLVDRVISNFDILVGKLAARTEMSMKNHVWRQITEAVNAVGSFPRTVPHCKKRYQDIKRSIRKKFREQRKHSTIYSRPIFLNTYEGILRPYIHVRTRMRTRGCPNVPIEDQSDSDQDLHESPPASPPSIEETLDASCFYPEPEEGTTAVLPEPTSLNEKGNPNHYNQTESEAGTSQVPTESHSDDLPISNNNPEPWQPPVTGLQRSAAKKPITRKLTDQSIRRFLQEQTLHRKTLMRKLNALHEDVCHLTQTFAKATSEQNHLLGRIVTALEERNRIETEQHKTCQKMGEALERTCVHCGLTSNVTDG